MSLCLRFSDCRYKDHRKLTEGAGGFSFKAMKIAEWIINSVIVLCHIINTRLLLIEIYSPFVTNPYA